MKKVRRKKSTFLCATLLIIAVLALLLINLVPSLADYNPSGTIAWAKQWVGQTSWYCDINGQWYSSYNTCEAFIECAFGTIGQFGSAMDFYNWISGSGRLHGGSPPAGAVAFYNCSPYGHVAISLGDGNVVCAGLNTVVNTNLNYFGGYLGWGYAPWGPRPPVTPADPIRIYQGIWTRVGPYFQSGYFDSAYVLKNYGSKTLTILPAICARGPNNENFDLGDIGWKTVAPGQTVTVFKSTWLRAQGRFTVFASYRDQAGNWHNINPGDGGTTHSTTINVEPISKYIKLSKGIWVHQNESGAGEYFDSLFEVTNYASNNSAYFEPYIWVRGPDNNAYDLGGIGYVKLDPGKSISCFKINNNFGQILGVHRIGACAHIGYAPSWTQWYDLQSGVSGTATQTPVVIATPKRNAKFVSNNIPTKMQRNKTVKIKITVMNTSTNVTWIKANAYLLGIKGGFSPTEVTLPDNNIVSINSQKTFTFNLKAPSKAGTYKITCQMKRKNIAWFGVKLVKTVKII